MTREPSIVSTVRSGVTPAGLATAPRSTAWRSTGGSYTPGAGPRRPSTATKATTTGSARAASARSRKVMGPNVYNGKMYFGSLPLARIFRHDGGGRWTPVGHIDHTPDVKYHRAWSMAVYQGRLFVGTLPSGHVWSFEAGKNATDDHPLRPGWRHIVAMRQGTTLKLYIDETQVATLVDIRPGSLQPLERPASPHWLRTARPLQRPHQERAYLPPCPDRGRTRPAVILAKRNVGTQHAVPGNLYTCQIQTWRMKGTWIVRSSWPRRGQTSIAHGFSRGKGRVHEQRG